MAKRRVKQEKRLKKLAKKERQALARRPTEKPTKKARPEAKPAFVITPFAIEEKKGLEQKKRDWLRAKKFVQDLKKNQFLGLVAYLEAVGDGH